MSWPCWFNDADALVCDEELDWVSAVGSAEADVELAHVAHADLPVGVDLVLADPEVGGLACRRVSP